jgi:hypothetical protein
MASSRLTNKSPKTHVYGVTNNLRIFSSLYLADYCTYKLGTLRLSYNNYMSSTYLTFIHKLLVFLQNTKKLDLLFIFNFQVN